MQTLLKTSFVVACLTIVGCLAANSGAFGLAVAVITGVSAHPQIVHGCAYEE